MVNRGKISASSEHRGGTVVLDILVSADGQVLSANYNAAKSDTSDETLIEKAISAAKDYKFAPSSNTLEKGTITFRFTPSKT